MRFAILSCIHANLPALKAVLRDAEQERCDTVLCLGDIVGGYDHPKECLDLMRSHCQACVQGNHDEYCSSPSSSSLADFNPRGATMVEWTRGELTVGDRSWLSELPYVVDIADFTIVHASLEGPERWGYIFDKIAAASHFTKQDRALCFNGHTHFPVVFQSKKGHVRGATFTKFTVERGVKYLVNVGSVGLPRDGCPKAAYAVYDDGSRTVELRRVDYPRPPSGGYGVGQPVPGNRGPLPTLEVRNDCTDDDETGS